MDVVKNESAFYLSFLEKLDIRTYDRLIALYGSDEALWNTAAPPVSDAMLQEWKTAHLPASLEKYRRTWEMMESAGIRFISRSDQDYPESFFQLGDPPVGVFLRGRLPAPEDTTAAIIGSRRCTPYGKACASSLAADLAELGIWIVSGMALGIDAWSQWSALDVGGPSLAVLGCGIDICYPGSHRRLYDSLIEKGGILSEYPPGIPALPFHFPVRNRLISALSQAVIVVEARKRSGTLITVDSALELGREVLAFPGRADDLMSEGTNHLIRQGASICLGTEDVLRALNWQERSIQKICGTNGDMKKVGTALTPSEDRLYRVLSREPKHLEQLMKETGQPVGELMVNLWGLERKKLCRQISAGTYQKV